MSPSLADRAPAATAPLILFRRHPMARRYTLRLNRDGALVVTIPRGGSRREALGFVRRSQTWIETERARRAVATGHAHEWSAGLEILFRGARTPLVPGRWHGRPYVQFGGERVFLAGEDVNLRRPVEGRLREIALRELPARTHELSRELAVAIRSVSVRDQSSRWGSCSSRGVISLNWRLVQTPAAVRDYLIIHELMHRREMNHSIRFWRHVAAACPGWREAEAWLDRHATELGFG